MKKKIIPFTDEQIKFVEKLAKKQETTFIEMLKRILDDLIKKSNENQ